MIAGVDEAGRGPVLGPLVVAVVVMPDQRGLKTLGIKDSKLLTPAKREALVPAIRERALAVETRVIAPAELNERMPKENLNEIEVAAFAELLDRVQATSAILDACDVDEARFGREVGARLRHACTIQSLHGADKRHAVVAAASIIAKVERDRIMEELRREHGACGSGYAGDAQTQAWLKDYVARHKKLPAIARREWETAKRLVPVHRSLAEFGI